MVKADLTRDYYADLELQQGASEAEIKKQFRHLALKYHPDRNPGRESEFIPKFQAIQTAQEVLTDPEQKSKYDNARLKNNNTRVYNGFGTPSTTASGTRGNPWSSAGSEWAPPPKPPPPFDRRRPPPPTSAGAARYATNFTPPNGTPLNQNQGAEAPRDNLRAWERMKPSRNFQPTKPVPKEYTPQSGREESNNYRHPPPPKSSKPGYEEFRTGASSQSNRTSPSRPSRKNGFVPSTPGPGEPPASSTSAYSTYRNKPSTTRRAEVPEGPQPANLPPDPFKQFRENAGTPFEPRLSTPYATHGGEKTNPFEKINLNRSRSTREPSEKTNSTKAGPAQQSAPSDRHRSASPPYTRPYRNLSPEPDIARANSDNNLGSPKRTHSSANQTYRPRDSSRNHTRTTPTPTPPPPPPLNPNISSDSDDSDSELHRPSFGARSRTFTKRRATHTIPRPKESQVPLGGLDSGTGESDDPPRKQSLEEFRKWWSTKNLKENELKHVQPDGTPKENRGNDTKDAPSMYANPAHFNTSRHSAVKKASTLPPVLEENLESLENMFSRNVSKKCAASSEAAKLTNKHWLNIGKPMTDGIPLVSPSGDPTLTPPGTLTSFEATQRKLVEDLLELRINSTKPACGSMSEQCRNDTGGKKARCRLFQGPHGLSESHPDLPLSLHLSDLSTCPSCDKMGSPFRQHVCFRSASSEDYLRLRNLLKDKDFARANKSSTSSFSFKVGDDTFKSAGPSHSSFTSSTENISTTFTPEHWHGKFEAGDYFANDRAGVNGRSRTRSGSRNRTRSPAKGRPISRSQGGVRPPIPNIDPEILQQRMDSDPISSPGGTKFTPEEWARTFKPETFAPPPYPPSSATTKQPPRMGRRSRTGSSTTKPLNATRTAGTAAMVSEDDGSELPLEMEKRSAQQTVSTEANHSVPSIGTDSPNAMDIDPPLDQQSDGPKVAQENGFTTVNNAANEARNVPVEPSRPEWRAGDASGSDASAPPVAPKQPSLPPRPANASTNRRRTTKSADEEDFKTNFEDLKNIEPLHNPATGLHSFSDLTSTLPFPSRAASTLTIPRNFASGELDLPQPPRAPLIPPVTNATRPPKSSWDSYLVAFKGYMAEWDIFNTKMIMHFVARKNQVDGMKPGWLEAFGDSDLDKYKGGLVEDFKVRQWWDVACENHQDAIEKLQFFKGYMREGVPARPAN